RRWVRWRARKRHNSTMRRLPRSTATSMQCPMVRQGAHEKRITGRLAQGQLECRDGRIFRIRPAVKSEALSEMMRAGATHRIDGIHAADAARTRNIDQVPHQQAADAAALPFAIDRYGAVAAAAVLARAVL